MEEDQPHPEQGQAESQPFPRGGRKKRCAFHIRLILTAEKPPFGEMSGPDRASIPSYFTRSFEGRRPMDDFFEDGSGSFSLESSLSLPPNRVFQVVREDDSLGRTRKDRHFPEYLP